MRLPRKFSLLLSIVQYYTCLVGKRKRAVLAAFALRTARLKETTVLLSWNVNSAVVVHFQHVNAILVELFVIQNPVYNTFHNLFTFLLFNSTCQMLLHIRYPVFFFFWCKDSAFFSAEPYFVCANSNCAASF